MTSEPRDMFGLSGKVALVTGSTKGIGKAIAAALAGAGAKVVISSRNRDACAAVARELTQQGAGAIGIPCNISRREEIERLVAETIGQWGRLDTLVANAAVNPFYGSMAELTEEAYDKTMNANVKNLWWLCNQAFPHMAGRGGGSAVIVSSVAGFRGSDKIGIYSLSKAADFQLTRNLAVEWGRRGIRVNCIAPGLVRTDFARAIWENPAILEERLATCPLGRIGEPEDIAGVAVFLASEAARFMTGQVLTVDGGVMISNTRYG